MRDVLDELLALVEGGRDRRRRRPSSPRSGRAPRQPGASMLVGAGRRGASASVSGGCVEGAVYELAAAGASPTGSAGAPALRRQRRRRVRGRPDLRRHPRRLRRAGRRRRRSPSSARSPPTSRPGSPSPSPRWSRTPTPRRVGRRADRPTGSCRPGRSARAAPTTRSPTTSAGCSPPGATATLHYGPDGERRGEGMRVFVASYAPKPRMLVFGAIDFAAAVARHRARSSATR